jgi:plasmid stability protein
MATLTLRNVPDDLYERLKVEAKRNGRSLKQEAILRLQLSRSFRSDEEIRQAFDLAAEFRNRLGRTFDHHEVDAMIREGQR